MIGARRIVQLLGVLLAAGALAQPAWAEGGLPGSPQAIRRDPDDAIPLQRVDEAAMAAQPAGPGGAILNPFAESALPVASHQPAPVGQPEPEGPGYTLPLFVALVCTVALGWLCRRAWTAVG
ncbi:hypothetical protein [Variovorax guangxiensis]|uniref:hypothetical protein n=1 Tax=Variovorax guangxiensis TaxID=1775474 RepID=UPI0028624808|nr:hypothetical protein [Variovorax guangxiensis]MDR6857655.1 hypothetical protein [Variovorax guangxiensis]